MKGEKKKKRWQKKKEKKVAKKPLKHHKQWQRYSTALMAATAMGTPAIVSVGPNAAEAGFFLETS